MPTRVTYELRDGIATLTMDDGKPNALSIEMISEIGAALSRAEADRAPVVLSGRDGMFSAGFDLKTMKAGGEDARRMIRMGFELSLRLLSFPAPVVVACTGHALAMGAFLLLSGDYRVGAAGPYKVGANEVAIGLTMPFFGVEICRQRLTPAHFQRSVINAEIYDPEGAMAAGFLDRLVSAPEVLAVARSTAQGLGQLPVSTHTATKLRVRAHALTAIAAAIETDDAFFRGRDPLAPPAPTP